MKEQESMKEMRKIVINGPQIKHYVDNTIKTAKYNWLTFLPLAVMYQFNNYFNVYFLLTAIILAIKVISPMDPGVAIGPFIFVIMVSVVREAIEDYKKSVYDKTYNNSTTRGVNFSNQEEKLQWSNVRVGSIIKIQKNEVIPADVLVIKTSLSNGFCYMETTNLDGESSLKPREAVPIVTECLKCDDNDTIDVSRLKGMIEVDQPDCNIYLVNGTIQLISSQNEEIKKAFFNIDNVLLRGTTLKNVDYAYGLVLYTGLDTKIMKNIQTFSLKNSSIQKTLNKVVIAVIIIVFSICVGCTMFGMIFLSGNVPRYEEHLRRADYIYYNKSANFSYTLEFFSLFGAFFIIFNNIIPISLTITFEIAKWIQVWIISKDGNMYDLSKGEKFKIFSMKLQEDLGNVKYIFTDKTGTLTKNEMIFRACSIYSHLFFQLEKKVDEVGNNENENNNPQSQEGTPYKSVFSPLFDITSITNALNSDLPLNIDDIRESYYKSTRDAVIEFFLNISLNHTVLTEYQNNELVYQGANPDEVTLVTSAKEIGIKFLSKNGNLITIEIDGFEYKYEILHKFEFSSERARSSIIIKDLQTSEIKLFIKGSDEKIMKILDSFSHRNLEVQTKQHLEKFAKTGLRTLCYAVKLIKPESYEMWNKTYEEIKYNYLQDKKLKPELDAHIESIEKKCLLLGVSGLEDRLQDDVKQTINALKEAGIQLWMITGDKLDTAESIGYSSKIFDDDTEIFKIRNCENKEEVLNSMNKILEEISVMENQINQMKLARRKKSRRKNTNSKPRFNIELTNPEGAVNNLDDNKIDDLSEKLDNNPDNILQSESDNNINNNIISLKFCEESNTRNEELSPEIKLKEIQNDNMLVRKHKTMGMQNENNLSPLDPPSEEENSESPSQVDDVSVMKFMVDKNYFDDSLMDKKEFAETFMNQILKIAGDNQSVSVYKRSLENANDVQAKQIRINSRGEQNEEVDLNIRLNKRNNIEIEVKSNQIPDQLALKDKEDDVEELDLSNLYDHYQLQLNKIQERKNSVRKILKFTNLDFPNFIKKKKEDEEHEMKDVNLLNFGLVIEGSAINMCLDDSCKATFWKLIVKSRSIICCRCNPIQKSDIVNFVKKKTGEVCLSIGDGGNDVNMIKAANVGVGIFGKEGYQAAYNADYAISQFKYLTRLLFVHGRYSLLRNSYFIYFFFYKSLIFCVPNLWFAFFSGFSGTLLWDNLYFILYTSILSTVPPVVFMVWEEDIDINFEGYHNKNILTNLIPDIYKEYRNSSPFNSLKFFIIFLLGILHSAIIYFFPLFVFRYGNQDETGRSHTLWDQSLLGVLTVMIVQYYIIFQDTFNYSTPVIIAHTVQILINTTFFILYGVFGNEQLGAFTFDVVTNVKFWFVLVITLAIDLLFVIISRKIDILLSDNIINNLRNRKYEDDYTKKIYMKKLEHMSRCTRGLAKFKKIYRNTNFEADNYADRKMKEFVEMYKRDKIKSQFNSPNKNKILKSKSLEFGQKLKEKLNTLNIKIQTLKNRRNSITKEVGELDKIILPKEISEHNSEKRSKKSVISKINEVNEESNINNSYVGEKFERTITPLFISDSFKSNTEKEQPKEEINVNEENHEKDV